MPAELLPTRTRTAAPTASSTSLMAALVLHALVLGGLALYAFVAHRANPHWGDRDPVAGAIQASAVSAIPLPPRQRLKENSVLTSDKPNVAPTPPPPTPAPPTKADPVKPKAEPPPKPNEVLIPTKVQPPRTPVKTADRPQPEPTKRPVTPPPPPPTKATTGDTSGVQIPQAMSELKNGTATVTVDERAFGDRNAYYIRLISQKINQSKQQDSDPPETRGRRTAIRFTIDRDGTPTNIEIATRSGSAALDTNTLRAIQRIDTFGPLPQGDHITITFGYTSH